MESMATKVFKIFFIAGLLMGDHIETSRSKGSNYRAALY